jgi:hypothetical protein
MSRDEEAFWIKRSGMKGVRSSSECTRRRGNLGWEHFDKLMRQSSKTRRMQLQVRCTVCMTLYEKGKASIEKEHNI